MLDGRALDGRALHGRTLHGRTLHGRTLHGGDLSKMDGLRHILSIGYEIECGVLAKLTQTDIGGELTLYNSDSARKDIEELRRLEEDPDADVEDYILERQEEVMTDVILDRRGRPDKHAVFNITNDNAMTPFIRMLDKICYYDAESADAAAEKNELYVFRDNAGKDYKIQFMLKDELGCAFHTSVEWVVTYYKPKRSRNVIMDTFVNMITNLVRHLDELVPIEGNYIVKYKNDRGDVEELPVGKPSQRMLFHKTGTGLYYLQTQVSAAPMTIDDACSVVQMTFSASAEHIVEILLALLDNNAQGILSYSENTRDKLVDVRRIEGCVDELIRNYNREHDGIYKIHGSKQFTKTVKTYIFMILFKIAQYIKFKKTSSKYFKNVLYINSRHSNYALYKNLKRQLEIQFGMLEDARVATIIKDIVLVPDILQSGIVPDGVKMRTGVFSKTNMLDKTNQHYGDPTYSLMSYFDFFEQPVDNEKNRVAETGKIVDYDWFEYKGIDEYSNKMELNNDIVLIEMRNFQKLLSLYVYNMADAELKEQMESGSCNILTGRMGADVGSLSIANFRKIIDIYGTMPSVKSATRKSKGKSQKKKSRTNKSE
jgi:hypothetical protein